MTRSTRRDIPRPSHPCRRWRNKLLPMLRTLRIPSSGDDAWGSREGALWQRQREAVSQPCRLLCDGHAGHAGHAGRDRGSASRSCSAPIGRGIETIVDRRHGGRPLLSVNCRGCSMNPLIPSVRHYRGASRLRNSILAPLRHSPCLVKLSKVHESQRLVVLFRRCLPHMLVCSVHTIETYMAAGDRHRNDLISSIRMFGSL